MNKANLLNDYAVTDKRTLRRATADAVAQFLLAGGSITVAKTKSNKRMALSKHMGRTNVFGVSR